MKRTVKVKPLGLFLISFIFVFATLIGRGDAGKTFKLPHYEVQFGTWPLMQVTKTRSLFKSGPNRPRGIGPGGPPNGPHRPFTPGPPGGPPYSAPIRIGPHGPGSPGGYRLGPPPTPSKLLLLNPAVNKGRLHKQLQETLKHYAASSHSPVNLQLPIIVKAPGPNPPPPPPGYKLGPPVPGGSSSWSPGPPYSVNDHTNPEKLRGGRLASMLKNVASSGMFKNAMDSFTFTSPEFEPGPPLSGTFITVEPDGTQIRTHVNGDVIPGERPNPSGIEIKPQVLPVLKIGDNLPENYTVLYAQRQILGLKAPDTLANSGIVNPGTDEYDASINLGGKYEQGYGRKPPPSHPLVITKFKRVGWSNDKPDKLVEQSLPETGLLSTTNMVFATPNISAPLNGKNSVHFQQALEDKKKVLKSRKKEKPLDAQVKLLGRLFTKLQRLKPPLMRVPAENEDEHLDHSKTEPGGWNQDDDEIGWNKVAKTKVDSPIMAVQIQTFSQPEVNSSDPDIVESMAEFGVHDVEFAETDELVGLMDSLMKHGSTRVNLKDLGSNPEEINENLLNWVNRQLALARAVNGQAHSKGEEIANNQFKQYQTFVTPPFGSNGWGPAEPMPVDPKVGRPAASITSTSGGSGMSF